MIPPNYPMPWGVMLFWCVLAPLGLAGAAVAALALQTLIRGSGAPDEVSKGTGERLGAFWTREDR